MPKILRYKNKKIQQHLIQQYALGLLSPAVSKRLEKLMQNDTELKELNYLWQQRLTKLADAVPPQKAPDHVWKNLSYLIKPTAKPSFKLSFTPSFIDNFTLQLWQGLTAACFCLLAISTFFLWQAKTPLTEASASYLAVMKPIAMTGENIEELPQKTAFVLSAYQGNKPGHSQLKIQWQQQQPNELDLNTLILWSINKETNKKEKVGVLGHILQQEYLTKAVWLKIKNSQTLEIAQNNRLLYSGICLQLDDWQGS